MVLSTRDRRAAAGRRGRKNRGSCATKGSIIERAPKVGLERGPVGKKRKEKSNNNAVGGVKKGWGECLSFVLKKDKQAIQKREKKKNKGRRRGNVKRGKGEKKKKKKKK